MENEQNYGYDTSDAPEHDTRNEQNYNSTVMIPKKENFAAGCAGAFLFSLAGVVLWFVIYQLGFIAGLAGFVMIVCAVKGYEVFGGALSKKGVIACIIITAVMIFVSQYVCLGYEIYTAFKADYMITVFDAMRSVWGFLTEPEVLKGFLIDLAVGYGLAAWGSFSKVKELFARVKPPQNFSSPEF